jgi:hypothetical protein
MPNDRHSVRDAQSDSSTRLLPNPPRRHTHVQQVAGGTPVDLPRPDQC